MINSQDATMIMSSRETNSSIVEKSKKIEILVISGRNNSSINRYLYPPNKQIPIITNSNNLTTITVIDSYCDFTISSGDHVQLTSVDKPYWDEIDWKIRHREDCDLEYQFLWIFINRLNKFLRRRLYFENLKHTNTYSFRSSIPKLIKCRSPPIYKKFLE